MKNARNLSIYRLWSPVYDALFGPLLGRARRRAVELLALQPGERLLIPGIGTGLDLPAIPVGVSVVGGDLSLAMLSKAQAKARGRSDITLLEMDAQRLNFPDHSFDAVLLNLILSVVPDGAETFKESWRVLRPGGRMVIFDKFLPEQAAVTPIRALIGLIARTAGTDPNRRLSELIGSPRDLLIACDEPALLSGQYRVLLLVKQARES